MKLFQTLGLIAALCLPTTALADRDAVFAALDAQISAFEAKDYEAAARMMPVRQLEVMAELIGENVDYVVSQQAQRNRNAEDHVTVELVRFDRDSVTIDTLEDMTPYSIVMLLSYWRLNADNLVESRFPVLVFLEDDQWVISRVQTPRDRLLLTRAYPKFADLTFPEGRMFTVWENEIPPEALE